MLVIPVISLLAAVSCVRATDYCTMSCRGRQHIACGHDGGFDKTCPAGARLVNMEPHKAAILDWHNSKRDLIASGKLEGFMPAQRMASMEWDSELASLAELNVKQCTMKHDACRKTDKFQSPGQNLAYLASSGNLEENEDLERMSKLVDGWWSENKYANNAVIRSYPRQHGATIGHFTVMAVDRNTRVGCAAAKYTDNFNRLLLACNYAHTNIIARPVYTTGEPGSGCRTGTNQRYKNLCSANEYNASK